MADSNSSSPSIPNLNSNRESHTGKSHGHWHRFFKFTKKDRRSDGGPITGDLETKRQVPQETDVPRQDQFEDRARSKSLRSTRSRIVVPSTPRSGKLFTFNNRPHRMRFLKKSSASGKKLTQVDVEKIQDAQQLFTESSSSPSSIIPIVEEAEPLVQTRKKRVSLRAIRYTQANLTMLFAKDDIQTSPQARSALERTKSETRSGLWMNPSVKKEDEALSGPRTRSLLDVRSWPSFKEQRLSSVVLSLPCHASVKTRTGDSEDQDYRVVSVHSDCISSESLDNSASEGSRLFSFRRLFHEPGSQDQRAKTSHISLDSCTDRHLQKPPKEESNRLLMRRSSSLPHNIHASASSTKGALNSQRRSLASSDDGLQCPWGVKAGKEESESSLVRNIAPLTFRIADISSALHLPGKRVNSSSSESINLSDDDHEHIETDFSEKQEREIEMQHDDFIEYSVKLAKKQRK